MEFSYTPKRLTEAADEIARQHENQCEIHYARTNDKLKKLIERIAALELYQVEQAALVLPEEDVLRIAGYLPHNYYNVEMKNLFLVFNYRSSRQACKMLYKQWQTAYDNVQCNQYIREQLRINEKFIMLMRGYHMSEQTFDEILSSDRIAFRFVMECTNREFPKEYSLLSKMNYFGVQENTRLYRDCLFLEERL